jgi:PIF1 helicase.
LDQERAFKIIAKHAVHPQKNQLKMYLGGMGGTGKSQIIKTLTQFFINRNESHRIVLLGPTGTSAALLGGMTYHSFLGIQIGDNIRNESVSVAQLKARLEGVDYIFIDEVSMIACHEMYNISSQLAKALNISNLPFGGLNMIFAGDFAQLPPVGGASLYSGGVGAINTRATPRHQEAAIGKALWHQVTTVVILKENMRQKSQTKEDASLRKALVNMRYGQCTPEDIIFLRTRIAGHRADQPKVSIKEFRNVAIICGVHTQKDMINQLGSERFAAETNQTLTHFYSIDEWGKEIDPAAKKKWGKSKAASKTKHKSSQLGINDQQIIWKLRHGATEHFAGKLSLCIGMPIMIRNNDATELCITKGQEGFVAGWQSFKSPHGKLVLDTLFVELNNPPQLVQIPGLPDNIVPIVKSTKIIKCILPDRSKESIKRQQA